MKLRSTILSLALLSTAGSLFAQGYPQNYPQNNQPNYQQGPQNYPQGDRDRGGWDAPPQDFRSDMQRQGFRDGISGARQDFEAHRRPYPQARPEYRRPPVPRFARNEYREGYQRGYDIATRHMMERHDDHRDDHHDGGNYPR